MKDKLLALWAKVQPLAAKAYACAPFPLGVLAGYFGKPIIDIALQMAMKLLKTL